MFAMAVNQALPGKKTLRGRKSWFFSDERILCLGSDISCDEAEYATQTTLCQKRLPKNGEGVFAATLLDGADFASFPEERTLDDSQPHWFLDVQQTGYYLPAGQKVTVARKRQKSREYSDLRDTEGDFLTAWIDHGSAPSAASYEYLLVIRATPEAMQKCVADRPYQIMQRDQAAHIVWDNAGGRWGCVFFGPQEVTPHRVASATLQTQAVDRPCLVMEEAAAGGKLNISVADPDLNLEAGVNQPRKLRVTLRGSWRVQEATGTVCAWQLPQARDHVRLLSSNDAETMLEITCQHGASYDILLASVTSSGLGSEQRTRELRAPAK
jgi:chondroitin-sulfate-ABC endolyase/exolyase